MNKCGDGGGARPTLLLGECVCVCGEGRHPLLVVELPLPRSPSLCALPPASSRRQAEVPGPVERQSTVRRAECRRTTLLLPALIPFPPCLRLRCPTAPLNDRQGVRVPTSWRCWALSCSTSRCQKRSSSPKVQRRRPAAAGVMGAAAVGRRRLRSGPRWCSRPAPYRCVCVRVGGGQQWRLG